MVLRIKELREAAGLSQVQLADSMGVAQSAVSSWETEVFLPRTRQTEVFLPRTRQLPLLAQVLGCEYNDLFAETPTVYSTA